MLTIHREFTSCGENSYWCFAVEYLYSKNDQSESNKSKTGKPKIDYKEVLSPEDFALFAKLRDWRKEIANIDKVPLYTIFNNEQLAQIAREKITTNAGLHGISGVGETRAKKYCEADNENMLIFISGFTLTFIIQRIKLCHQKKRENS